MVQPSKSGINSPVFRLVVDIPLFTRVFYHHPKRWPWPWDSDFPGAEDDASTVFEQQGGGWRRFRGSFSQVQICMRDEEVKISLLPGQSDYHKWQEKALWNQHAYKNGQLRSLYMAVEKLRSPI